MKGYKPNSFGRNAIRSGITTKWRSWAKEHGAKGEAAYLREVIAVAYLRLERLDDSNPEVVHARSLLECAIDGGDVEWP